MNAQTSSTRRTAFVTGASGGIGQALARRFFDAGYRLALVARDGDTMRQWAAAAGWPILDQIGLRNGRGGPSLDVSNWRTSMRLSIVCEPLGQLAGWHIVCSGTVRRCRTSIVRPSRGT